MHLLVPWLAAAARLALGAACVPRGAVKADSIAVLRSSHFDEVKRSTSFAIKFKKVIAIESVRKARSLCATISYFSSCMYVVSYEYLQGHFDMGFEIWF